MTRNSDPTVWNPDIKDFLRLSYMKWRRARWDILISHLLQKLPGTKLHRGGEKAKIVVKQQKQKPVSKAGQVVESGGEKGNKASPTLTPSQTASQLASLPYSWFATMWQGGHVGGQNKRIFPRRIYMKIEFSSQRREMLLFLTTTMAAVTSRANQQLCYLRPKYLNLPFFWAAASSTQPRSAKV